MKRLLFLMVAFAFVGTAAMAQQEQPKDFKKTQEEWEKKVKDELKLTTDQDRKSVV